MSMLLDMLKLPFVLYFPFLHEDMVERRLKALGTAAAYEKEWREGELSEERGSRLTIFIWSY